MTFMICYIMNGALIAQKNEKTLAQQYLNTKGEVIFDFVIQQKSQLSTITKQLAIVHYDDATKTVKAMANKLQFAAFLQKNIPFKVSSTDNVVGYRTMTSDLKNRAVTFPLTAYPTYTDYEAMMNDFASNHPSLCKVENIGATTQGDKSILFVKLSDNVNADEQEPRVMFTSTMHGDELAGYPMMLNLIDFLLTVYNDTSHPRHAEIKNLLDNTEVWINPLANPDGAYRGSANNTSVAGATRGNANNVDLNRNYPDPDDGTNPDGNVHQVETIAFMNFANAKHFVLSANFHGGIELINYPWDTYAGDHPDKDYFVHISEEYRDHCQANSPAGYFDDLNNGITNGFAWYEVQGGRQDWQIYFEKGREVTVELSATKAPAASQLVNFWNYNKEALISLLKQVQYGVRGVVTDAVTNQPIQAKVTIVGKEAYESWVPAELPHGDYYRPVKAGTYNILFEADCYQPVTLTGVSIADYATVVRNVQLTPLAGTAPVGLATSSVQTTSATLQWTANGATSYNVRYRAAGTTAWAAISSNTNTVTISGLASNTQYEAQVRSSCTGGVNSPYSTSINFTTTDVSACSGVNSFPYSESFESGLGLWTNATSGDDLDWTRDSGGTPSSNTGPSSGSNGSFYMYVEASGNGTGFPNKVATLNSPCFDISALTNPTFKFDYHMYGSQVNNLKLEVSTNNGGTWTQAFTKSGNQGNSWLSESVDLTPYQGSNVSFRFTTTTGSGNNGWQSDIAIDHISVEDGGTTPPASYCASKGDNVSDEYINRVQFGSIDNTSGVNGGYADFTTQSTTVAKGSNATITITPAWTGTVYSEGYAVWIDFNQNGDFTDVGDLVFTRAATQSTPISGTISIPSTALEGNTRMRVSMKYNGIPTSCETFTYGEVEDYTINIGNKSSSRQTKHLAVDGDDLILYPNPVKGGILYIKNSVYQNKAFTIKNNAGQKVYQGKLANNQLNISQLPAGMYILEVDAGNKLVRKKFVVNK
ncbi:hypothetical protein BKI52_28895 [marine bacterium AO1-C]|nr:hypothetical protein BKI52_28895 [marine bacterium AO1-C]